jgi:tyrosyl-tRNA synthetase
MTVNINEYRDAVAKLAENDINAVFPNDGNAHALVVFEQMFKTASNSISIAAASLCGEFTNNKRYIDSVKSFLEKAGSQLRLLINNPEEIPNSDFFKSIKDFDNVSLRSTEDTLSTAQHSPVHLCIGDNKMYRIEYDIQNRKAYCNFNDKGRAEGLLRVFDTLFEKSDPISLSGVAFA